MSKKNKKAQDFLKQAYATDDQHSQLEFYKKWADDYDEQMEQGLHYLSPAKIAAALARHLPLKSAVVLDIGCGTGLTAQAVIDQGYKTIDGLDYSAEMVDVAKQKNIYRHLWVADLNQTLDIENCSYDAVISSGTFTHGHVGAEPLDELVRILKPGGFLACTIHQDLWQVNGFEEKFNSFESAQKLRELERKPESYFKDAERDGWFCVYEKV